MSATADATAAERWVQTRSFHHSRYPAQRIAAERSDTITVCVPARECARTIAQVVGELVKLREDGAIDRVVVVDAASSDGTAVLAERAGATVWQERELMGAAGAALGPVLGKGDAMWRALSALDSDLVCFLDGDSEGFGAHFATGLLGPLACEPGVSFVKGFYRRPMLDGGEGGGRVNHLMARPALELFFPELAGVRQPLAGEVAARRELLMELPFATGYGVEVAMLIDVWRKLGLDGMAQVDLDEHRNPHQPLAALTPMAATVLATIVRRAQQQGRVGCVADAGPLERPAHAGAVTA